ncbi:unnamed protein product, partial [Brenthis ino]
MWWTLFLFIIPAQASIEEPLNITSSPCTDSNHIFLAPGVLTAGGTSRSCISRFHTEGQANVVLTLVTEKQNVTASRELAPGDGGCIDISVPPQPNAKAELIVNIWYPEAQCTWERKIPIRIASGRIVIIHTDRARYRPGDKIHIRAIVLKADLTPSPTNIEEIWLEGPRGAWDGIKIEQWLNKHTRLGLVQVEHKLDYESSPPGKWSVRARLADGSHGGAAFWVGNYELPPFQLTVRHAPKILRTSERLAWTVCVRYPWSEAVAGMLVIRLRGAGGAGGARGGIRTAVRLAAPRACHRHAAAAKRIGLNGDSAPDVVIADFSFQEEGTRVWQNTTVVSQVVDEPFALEFLTRYHAVVSPGLPYKIKVKATRWDDKPVSNETVRVCRYKSTTLGVSSSPDLHDSMSLNSSNSSDTGVCVEGVTDEKGVARVMFRTNDDGSPFYNFKASLHNASARLWARGAGRSVARASLGALRAGARTLLPLYVSLPRAATAALTVHFVVITRGGIIYRWGATTQCPTKTDTYLIMPHRNATCPGIEPATDGIESESLAKVLLPVKVTPQMCPDSHLVAYFQYGGEIVTASKHMRMDECFVNKADITWASRQTPPGSKATLQVSTPGPALCALSVIDSAATWSVQRDSVKTLILNGLNRLMQEHRNLTEHDAAAECFLSADSPDLPSTGIELMSFWLASAGVRVLTTTPPERCSPLPNLLLADDVLVPRSDFSESWLWQLVAVGAAGAGAATARAPDAVSRYEATAVCLSRTGVAVSPPAVLQVFREFFIHASGPQEMKRGDVAIIPYRIFNYLYQPLSVEVKISTKDTILHSETVCVSPRASRAARRELAAPDAGFVHLRIRATTVYDAKCSREKRDVSDEVKVVIRVKPEGVTEREYKSALLCAPEENGLNEGTSAVTWSWAPVQAVPGTERVSVWAAENVVGPLLDSYRPEDMAQLQGGCGEQSMARLAINLLSLQSLDNSSWGHISAQVKVTRDITRQLQYVHPSGGFSAFGASDSSASTWLTAFCVRYLRTAFKVVSAPPPPALAAAERWLRDQQTESGCFRNHGHVFHSDLKGGLNEDGDVSSVALTAYVITSLLETPLPPKIIQNALTCLRAFPTKSKKVYPLSLVTYAYMKLKSYEEKNNMNNLKEEEVTAMLNRFLHMATEDNGYVWWDTGNLATSIEATGYALLSLRHCARAGPPAHGEAPGPPARCVQAGAGAVRWLSAQRGAGGGFLATQDTLIAEEGLSAWAHFIKKAVATVTIESGEQKENFKFTKMTPPRNSTQFTDMNVSQQFNVSIRGEGCALVHMTRAYNSRAPARAAAGGALAVRARALPRGVLNCAADVCFCAAVVEVCALWSRALPALALLELALPAGHALDAARLYALLPADPLLRRIEVTPNNGKASLYLGTRDGSDTTPRAGHVCYNIHTVGPRTKTKPAYAKITDYYNPLIVDTQMYTIPEDCPSLIAEEVNDYNASDNLFNKARSLTGSGEIIISYEYSLDDIPEGIPLEDPIYDNLTKRDDNKKKNDKNNKTQNTTHKNVNDYNRVKENDILVNNNKFNTEDLLNLRKINKTLNNLSDKGEINNNVVILQKDNQNISIENKIINLKDIVNVNTNKEISRNDKTKLNDVNNEVNSVTLQTEVKEHKIHIREDSEESNNTKDQITTENDKKEDKIHNVKEKDAFNPSLSTFHVINSEKDLDVPSGIEGPVPAVMLPPKNFVIPTDIEVPQYSQSWRSFPHIQYYQPIFYKDSYYTKNKHVNVPFENNKNIFIN